MSRRYALLLFAYKCMIRARRNSQGHLEPDAPEDVVDASMGWSNYEKAKPKIPKET